MAAGPVVSPGAADPGQVALDVSGEHRDALLRELLGEDLQRSRLPGPGRAGDQTVTVCRTQRQQNLGIRFELAVENTLADLESEPLGGVRGGYRLAEVTHGSSLDDRRNAGGGSSSEPRE